MKTNSFLRAIGTIAVAEIVVNQEEKVIRELDAENLALTLEHK